MKHIESTFFDEFICNVLEKYLVAGEQIMLPHVIAEPRSAERPESPKSVRGGSEAVDVRDVVNDRSFGFVVLARDFSPSGQQDLVHISEQRAAAFLNVSDLGVPVVHLQINVGMIIGIPRCFYAVRPYALKVRRERVLA